MKDITAVVEYIFGQNNPWAIALVVVCAAIFMLKVVREVGSLGHAVREKKLAAMLSYVDAGVNERPRFSIEHAFAQHYGRLIAYEDLSLLLDLPNPAVAVQHFIWSGTYIKSEGSPRQVTLSKTYRFRLRSFLLQATLLVTYFIAVGGALFLLASVIMRANPSQTLNAAFVAAGSAIMCYLSIIELRAISATQKLLKVITQSTKAALPPIIPPGPNNSSVDA